MLYLSGHGPLNADGSYTTGRVVEGTDVDEVVAIAAARQVCFLTVGAHIVCRKS